MFGLGFRHPHYAELLGNPATHSSGAGAVDFLEVHSENFFGAGGAARAVLQQARQHWPISLHGVGLGLGSTVGIAPWHLDQLADLVERTDPLLVSDHACFARGHLPVAGDVHAADLLPIPFSKAALEVLCANVSQVQDRLKRSIAVENLAAYFVWNRSDFSETQFLTELAKRSGCRLLIDVNNTYVNALNTCKAAPESACEPFQACQKWLNDIPAGIVAELHLAGHNAMSDIVIDDHSCRVKDPVWALYRHALSRFGLVPSLIEWDNDIPALSVLLGEVQRARSEYRSLA